MFTKTLIVALLLNTCFVVVNALNEDLKWMSEISLPPLWHQKNYTEIGIRVWAHQLSSVDDQRQTVAIRYHILLWWKDPRLVWKPEDVGVNLTDSDSNDAWTVLVQPTSIWTPMVYCYESSTHEGSLLVPRDTDVRRDGTVWMDSELTDTFYCTMVRKYYPFDQQKCKITLKISKWAKFSDTERVIEDAEATWQQYKAGKMTLSYEIGEWTLFGSKEDIVKMQQPVFNKCEEDGCKTQYDYYLTRRPLQPIMTWLVPPIVLSMATVVALYVPGGCEKRDRYALCSATLITMSVLLSSLMDHLATGADGYPIVAQLYLGLMFSLALAMLAAPLPESLAEKRWRWRRKKSSRTVVVSKFGTKEASNADNQIFTTTVIFWELLFLCSLLLLQIIVILICIVQWIL